MPWIDIDQMVHKYSDSAAKLKTIKAWEADKIVKMEECMTITPVEKVLKR